MTPAGLAMARVIANINLTAADVAPDDEQRLAALVAALESAAHVDDEELHAAITLTRRRAVRLLERAA